MLDLPEQVVIGWFPFYLVRSVSAINWNGVGGMGHYMACMSRDEGGLVAAM
jgi:hypothetical protein